MNSSIPTNAIVVVAAKVFVSNILKTVESAKSTHACPWLESARHIEQFDYYHPTKDILIKPCCSLRPKDPRDFQLDTGTGEANIKRMQAEFEQGHWPTECQVCRQEEQDGMISERIRAFEFMADYPRVMEQRIEIHIKLSNFCNLACRVCYPTESTTYGRTYDKDDPVVFTQPDISEHKHWPVLLDYLEKRILGDRWIDLCLVGGETTITPGTYALAEWLQEKGYIGKLNLALSSNMMNISDKLFDLFDLFKTVTVSASLDSTHDNFHYVRWPGTWDKATHTIECILERKRKGSPIRLQICPNFNINNVFYFDDFLDYWADNQFDLMMIFNFYAPEVFRIDTLPPYIRPALLGRLKSCLDHRFFYQQQQTQKVRSWLMTTIDRLSDEGNFNPLVWQRYLVANAEFDYSTDTSLWIYNSRLGDLFSPDDRIYYEQAFQMAQSRRLTDETAMLFTSVHPRWDMIPIREVQS